MKKLISEGWVSTKNQKGKTGLKVYLPEKISKKIHHSLPKQIRKNTPIWTRDYFQQVL